jgi:hypothetical protein
MSIILDLFKDSLGSMIQERHTGIGRRMSKELSRAISGKRLVRKYATKSIPAFRSPDVPYFPRSAFGRVLISPHYLHEQFHGIAPSYVGCFFLSRAQDNRNKQTMTPMRKRDCPRTPRMFYTIKCGSHTSDKC